MYTSIYSKKNGADTASQKSRGPRSRISDQVSISALEVNVRPVLEYNAKVLNGKITIKKILNEKVFVGYHDDFKEDFIIKCLPQDEDIQKWIDLPPHTNIVTAFDCFSHEDKKFSLCECTNAGNMYQYIERLNLNLAINVPQSYIETIYDCIIQLAMGLEFAHNNGLVHGQFDLSNVAITKEGDDLTFKVSDFRPITSMSMPLSSEGALWPFARNKKKISDAEKLELLMLKDIYALGICILELMIGRTSSSKFSISLDSLPLTWAEFQESTPLIQVLVECINIDSISQRKGKLQTIKKLLIKEYKKFFQRPFYKMEVPVVGKRADVCNKKAVMALSRGDEDMALRYWEEALTMKEEHFDTQLNYLMYKWRAAQISDEEMLNELDKFKTKDICQGLKGIIQVAIGEKDKGLEILRTMIQEEDQSDFLRNLKIQRFRQEVKEVFESVQLDKDQFFQNKRIKSEHKEKIENLNISVNGKYFCSTSKDTVNVWSLHPKPEIIISIPLQQDQQQSKMATRKMASVDSECKICAVYQGSNFTFQTYTIDVINKKVELKDTIDLAVELQRANYLEQNQKFDEFDVIAEIKLINEGKVLRVTQLRKKQPYLIDINLFDCTPEMKKIEKFEDKSIFKYGLTYVQYHDSFYKFLNAQLSKGNLIAFPEKEFQICVVLSREDKSNKSFLVYDIFGEKLIRRIKRKQIKEPGKDDSDSFDVDIDGQTLVYASGEDLVQISLIIPEPIQRYIRPRINQALHKENPAKIAAQKAKFMEKIIQNMKNFESLTDDQIKNRENSLLLMNKKIDFGFQNKRLLENNEEFLKLHKTLIKNQIPSCPITGVDSIQKIAIFDEIKFSNDLHRIKFIALSSKIDNNYMMLAIDGTVYKYDLASKEMLFSFKTQAFRSMMMYDQDSKLLCADTQQIKLWEFTDKKDDVPEMLSVLEVPLRINQGFVNKSGEKFYQIITSRDSFEVYHEKLDKLFEGQLSNIEEIQTVEFNDEGTIFYIGSNKGTIYKYTIETQNQETLDIDDESIDIIYCASNNVMICYVNGGGIKVVNFEEKKIEKVSIDKDYEGEVCQIRGTQDAQFVFIGIPSTSSFLCYTLDQSTLQMNLQKRIQVDFRTFEMDKYCTQVVFMNHKCRDLELYALKWSLDLSAIEPREYEKLDDTIVEEDESHLNSKGSNPILAKQLHSRPKTACCSLF